MSSTPQLRPMAISDILDAAFRLYRRHFVTFIGIVALLQVPMTILQGLAQLPFQQAIQRFSSSPLTAGRTPFDVFPFFAQLLPYYALIFGLSILQYLIVYNMMTGALANAISRSYLGRPISIFSSYALGFKRIFALIAASLIPLTVVLLVVGVISGCAVGALSTLGARPGERPNIALALGSMVGLFGVILLAGIAGLFFYVRLLLTTQAIVLEGQGPLAGLTRSWRLVGQAFWRSLGILLLVYAFIYLISLIVQLPLLAIGVAFGALLSSPTLFQMISLAVTGCVLILVLPLQFTIFTLLYYDLRIRKEGYDIELQAQAQPAQL